MVRLLTLSSYCTMLSVLISACASETPKPTVDEPLVRLLTLNPGHFHAALVQKNNIQGIDSNVFVYAPQGAELKAYLNLVDQYNTRGENPTNWNQVVYSEPDFASKMLADKKGNVVVLSGNNELKTKYISESIDSGLNVLADKPMAINSADFELLLKSFEKAKEKNVLLYDIMTERSEITNILQRELAMDTAFFGVLETGSAKDPAVVFENIHYFFKQVSGKDLVRPAWFFDAKQQGEAIADVGTHVVDLVQWECFPDQAIDYRSDIEISSSRIWPTALSLQQFSKVTGLDTFPAFLAGDVKGGVLNTHANGEVNYKVKGKHIRIATKWNFQAKEGGDTHYALLRGTKASLEVRQGKEEGFKPVLYLISVDDSSSVAGAIERVAGKYSGIGFSQVSGGFRVDIPEKYKVGHEAHFSEVMERFLGFLKGKAMPEWEVPCMVAKYFVTTKSVEMALSAAGTH